MDIGYENTIITMLVLGFVIFPITIYLFCLWFDLNEGYITRSIIKHHKKRIKEEKKYAKKRIQ